GLQQLAHDHPFLLTGRYASDRAEIRYWEEARDLHDAAAVALRLWGEHRRTAQLPPWEIVGLEGIDRDTYHQRVSEGYGPPRAAGPRPAPPPNYRHGRSSGWRSSPGTPTTSGSPRGTARRGPRRPVCTRSEPAGPRQRGWRHPCPRRGVSPRGHRSPGCRGPL